MPHPYAGMPYARTMAHVGRAHPVAPWDGTVLLRDAPEGRVDAAAPYPLLVPGEGADLPAGVQLLREAGAVSLVAVADPFSVPDPDRLRDAFERVTPFKTHLSVERAAGPFDPTPHHRQRIRLAGRRCRVRSAPLRDHLDEWCRLYAALSDRHAITGLHAFPRASFAALAEIEGLVAFLAETTDGVVAMHLWIDDGRVAYSHLAATDAAGYRARAPYALYAAAIEHFAARDAMDLGGGAGSADLAADGLAAFKRGFANAARTAHLCGQVLDRAAYDRLSAGREGAGYFPAYRSPA